MTMSVGDLLDEWFESDALKGAFASTGVVGRLGRPAHAGHRLQPPPPRARGARGVSGLWGHVEGGMGAISQALARSAEAAGATIRTEARRALDRRRRRPRTGVTLESGERLRRRSWSRARTRARPSSTWSAASHFPDEVVRDMRRYRSRGGSVKVNCVLSRAAPLRGRSRRRRRAPAAHRRGALPVDRLPRARLAGRDARRAGRGPLRRGRGAERGGPLADRRRRHRDDDVHPVRAAREQDWPEGAREAYARALPRHRRRARAEREGRARPPRGARAAGPRADLRPQRRVDLPGRAGPRPDGLHAPVAAARAVRHPGAAGSTCAGPAPTPAAA